MGQHRIKKGLNIPIAGGASGSVEDIGTPREISIDPREFKGLIPRLAAREGEVVKKGETLFFHKFNQEIRVVSPVSGRVKEVRRGARRVITDVVVEVDGEASVAHKAWTLGELEKIERETAKEQMLRGGVWPLMQTRPLDQIADPETVPQGILIGGYETGPLQPGADVLLGEGDKEALQAAIWVLRSLTDGKVYLTHEEGSSNPVFSGLSGADIHTFSGPHPAGDMGVQVNHISPPRGNRKVWCIRAWDAVVLGRLFLSGELDASRVYAAVGTGLGAPRYVRTVMGAPAAFVAGSVKPGDARWIRGSILTGAKISADSGAGVFPRAVHVIPEDVERELMGWALPKFGKYSFYRAFLSGFTRSGTKTYDLRPGLFGGHRAIIPLKSFRAVVPTPDIEPLYLFKSIIAGDLEGAIKLGLLDITMEEAALCSYIDPAKTDFDVYLSTTLDTYAKEAS